MKAGEQNSVFVVPITTVMEIAKIVQRQEDDLILLRDRDMGLRGNSHFFPNFGSETAEKKLNESMTEFSEQRTNVMKLEGWEEIPTRSYTMDARCKELAPITKKFMSLQQRNNQIANLKRLARRNLLERLDQLLRLQIPAEKPNKVDELVKVYDFVSFQDQPPELLRAKV